MKQLSKEQIQEIETMSELFYFPEDIADNLEIDAEKFTNSIQAKTGEAYKAYRKGWLTGDIKLRKAIASAAENGSSPAQVMMKQMQDKTKSMI
jgi:hypothetical protein